ncbi:class I SAM-dependent methyltransferase [Pseudooceanicola sp. CBS1P-1]|uniref:Class I SAM-dependent methyltransferase n=1 Tax=Pseudooceanicola albus TaxID=2692189 RepID=A0A6L7GBM7_9RHOB|nr:MULTISPECIES: class I SAM-dependent methyltransferase [Pseudooceanicola]MBT9386670.1 class I SAM-dependent methyltransferase [Pseudooceanicola endophyticus]MXN20918.1 class I SAM-dependent methyltransferase [Pseudooceanicola albus]
MTASPYTPPGFYDNALAEGRHRSIVGGRWDETGRAQMAILRDAGVQPSDYLLDIGAGSLRLGCKAVPYLDPGHYWATDASRALMLAGHAQELEDPARLDPAQLIEDAGFGFPGVPDTITHAIAFAVFPHLTADHLETALNGLTRFPRLGLVMFTVFLAPDADAAAGKVRQPDGVVTHPGKPPYHVLEADLHALAARSGWALTRQDRMLPRGQVLFEACRG